MPRTRDPIMVEYAPRAASIVMAARLALRPSIATRRLRAQYFRARLRSRARSLPGPTSTAMVAAPNLRHGDGANADLG